MRRYRLAIRGAFDMLILSNRCRLAEPEDTIKILKDEGHCVIIMSLSAGIGLPVPVVAI